MGLLAWWKSLTVYESKSGEPPAPCPSEARPGPGQDSVRRSWEEGVCAYCGEGLPERKGIGTGRRADGRFCTLDCLVAFHGPRLAAKAAAIQAASRN